MRFETLFSCHVVRSRVQLANSAILSNDRDLSPVCASLPLIQETEKDLDSSFSDVVSIDNNDPSSPIV